MSVEGQEAMQQVVQDAMAGMSTSGQGAPQDDAYSTDRDGEGVVGEGGGSDGGGGGGREGEEALLDESMSREQREEEWALRMSETEDAMVRAVAACRRCCFWFKNAAVCGSMLLVRAVVSVVYDFVVVGSLHLHKKYTLSCFHCCNYLRLQ